MSVIKKLHLYLATIFHLKVSQIYYQIVARVRVVSVQKISPYSFRGMDGWPLVSYYESSTRDGAVFNFLGELGNAESIDARSKLWRYNFHYHNDLNPKDSRDGEMLCSVLINDWIKANPPGAGDGWEPYCLSLRIVNWVKFFSRLSSVQLPPSWIESLLMQGHYLERQIEYHVLGNHILANAKALVFIGSYIGGDDGDRWLNIGVNLLEQELSEQFLVDGGHFERSPMYQATLLWDLADLIKLQRLSNLSILDSRVARWEGLFDRGYKWLSHMVHPDGEISFFNDATFGVAPTLCELERYAEVIGIQLNRPPYTSCLYGALIQPSGFGRLDWPEGHRLLVDVAPVGPDYQPGHAHADTLSCELSLFGQRVLVNSGISQYGEDAERHRQRSTPAHNTVAVNGENSSEVWAGFRVARRAMPFAVDLVQGAEEILLTASHDGYRRLPGSVTHCRKWHAQSQQLSIEDQLDGRFQIAAAYWHFHPDIRVRQINDVHFVAEMPQGQSVDILVEGGAAVLRDGIWHPGFGKSVPNKHLEIGFQGSKLLTLIKWRSA